MNGNGTQFGKLLKKQRLASGMNQRYLAQMMDLKASYISYLENGERRPSVETLAKLVKFFHLSRIERRAWALHAFPELRGIV